MPPRPTEADLLDLIEGSLSPARERELRAALATDGELSEQLRRMTQQRSMLRQLGDSIERSAPADLAEQAVLAARTQNLERMDMETSKTGQLRVAPEEGRGARRRAMAIAATVALLVVGGWVWFLVGKVGPEGTVNKWTRFERPWIEVNENSRPVPSEPDPEVSDGSDPSGGALAQGAVEVDQTGPDFVGPPVAVSSVATAKDNLLDEWVANLDAGTGEVIDAARAAELLGVGKLRVVVDAEATPENRSKVIAAAKGRGGMLASALAQDAGSGAVEEPRTVPDALNIGRTVVVALEPSRDRGEAEMKLDRLLAEVSSVTGTRARFEEAVPSEDPLAGLEASDILWWSRPSDHWRTRPVFRVPVVFGGEKPAKPGVKR